MKQHKKVALPFVKLLYICVILLILLTSATYTWWSLNRTVSVSGMAIYVNSPAGLEITLAEIPDEDDWGQQVDFASFIEDNPAVLRPATWSNEEETFYAASYRQDGRITAIDQELNDKDNANEDDSDGYYAKLTFFARAKSDVTISLSDAVAVTEGQDGAGTFLVGTPIWDEGTVSHIDGGMGAQYAMRIGFDIETFGVDGYSLDDYFYIYEPNADVHYDASLDGDCVDTYSIDDDDELLVDEDFLIIQEASVWKDSNPVVNDIVIYDMGEFITETTLFDLETGQTATINIYIWMEGQDIDCINQLGAGAEIFANIQFDAQASESQTGLVSLK